ncbi:MAG TPA: response regulator [Urbifossiella sp.]|nr:response regulator [Urbifossiella sp.]
MARLSKTPVSTSPGAPARASAVVLLVEDEPAVRTVTRRMLELRGFTVILAEHPEEALHIAAATSRVDVLLTDVQLPGMDGPELARQLRDSRPDLKVVFISGYPREDAFAHSTDDPAADFLQKPFTPKRLIEVLNRALSNNASTPPPGSSGDTQKLPRDLP